MFTFKTEVNIRRRIVTTGKGSDWFGSCDQCGKHCSEHFKCQTAFGNIWTNGAYGHKSCLESAFPEFIDHKITEDITT